MIADSDTEYSNAATLFKEYAAWLNIDLAFQEFEKELGSLKRMYGPPDGRIILCKVKDKCVACVAIRKINSDTAELKRMYVQQQYQKKGIGKALLERAIRLAREAGYSYIRLDTLSHMISAIQLYKQRGFYEIPAYYNNPNHTAVYFEIKC